MDKKLNYAVYHQRLDILTDKTRELLTETNCEDLVQQLNSDLATVTDRKQLKIAFVGQYSAGKSTIISALTGCKDIKIDANVATDKVSEYHWNNIILMDTPGILAGKTEAHDISTKEALSNCDLIFYVLTSQLFDDIVFNNFIDLAYNQHFADKMFIIINKMGMESGNYDDLVRNYTTSLANMFTERGYKLSDFPIAFIDAYDYIEGIEENDEEFVQVSHFEQFIDMLNSFVSRKGVIKKQFDTPIRLLQSYAKNIAVSAIDTTLAEFYRQFEQRLLKSQRELKQEVENILYSYDSNSMREVINLTNEIGEGIKEEDWKLKQDELNKKLENTISTTSNDIEQKIEETYKSLMNDLEDFGNKDAIVAYSDHLQEKLNAPNITMTERQNLTTQNLTIAWLRNGAISINNLAPNVNSVFGGISNASGSALHNTVYNTAKFFGKNFKPWEAVRWASNIAKFAKFGIPIITGGLDIFLQLRNNQQEKKIEKQIREAKNKMITSYQTEINKIKDQFTQYLQSVLNNYKSKHDEVNQSINQIIINSKRNDAITKKIKELEGEYIDFIEVIDKEK